MVVQLLVILSVGETMVVQLLVIPSVGETVGVHMFGCLIF